MGIHASIFSGKFGRDSLSVIPNGALEVLVVNAEGPFEPRPGDVLVKLEAGPIHSVRAKPLLPDGSDDDRWLMFGGRYIASSDARFRELVERLLDEDNVSRGFPDAPPSQFYGAIALHDRFEG